MFLLTSFFYFIVFYLLLYVNIISEVKIKDMIKEDKILTKIIR